MKTNIIEVSADAVIWANVDGVVYGLAEDGTLMECDNNHNCDNCPGTEGNESVLYANVREAINETLADAALTKIHAGQCNIETSDFGIENENAAEFAENNLSLIELDDVTIEDGQVRVDASRIELEFTKDWHSYQGAGVISIAAWDE